MEAKTFEATAPIKGSDALHSVRETCATLGIGATKCWELIGAGHLEAVRLGGRCTRIKKSSIDRLIEHGAATAAV